MTDRFDRSALADQRLKDAIRQVILEDSLQATPNSCEVSENSKGEARLTVKCYAPTLAEAIELALSQYEAARQRLDRDASASAAATRQGRTL